MRGINRVICGGNLGADPEVRYLTDGTVVTTFRIGMPEKRRGKDGSEKEESEWARVVCFGNVADSAGKYLSKGDSVMVEGRMRTRKWESKDGGTRSTTEVVAAFVHFLITKKRNEGGTEAARESQRPEPAGGGYDDEVPF